MVYLMTGLLVGQSQAAFKECYETCFIICYITPGTTLGSCAAKCLKDCIFPPKLHTLSLQDTEYFCKLGCATSLCTNLSSKDNPGKYQLNPNPLSFSFTHDSFICFFFLIISWRESGRLCEFLFKILQQGLTSTFTTMLPRTIIDLNLCL